MLELIVIIAGIIIDQLTKIWAAGTLAHELGGSIPVIKGVFNLTYLENRGAAFGMLQGFRTFFIILTFITIGILAYTLVAKRKRLSVWLRLALALILSGAAGNLIDRIALSYVRDMFDFCLINFAVFNFADACISVGAVLLVVCILFIDGREEEKKNSDGSGLSDEIKNEAMDAGVSEGGDYGEPDGTDDGSDGE